MEHILDKKNVELFEKHKVYSKVELTSRYEIHNECYSKVINIEALTMLDMAKKQILPAGSKFAQELAQTLAEKKSIAPDCDLSYESDLLKQVSSLTGAIYSGVKELEKAVDGVKDVQGGAGKVAMYYREVVFAAMNKLRASSDVLETLVPKDLWPFPTYSDLLFSVK